MGMEFQTFTLVDNRTCLRCGARAGKCSHLKADVVEKQFPKHQAGKIHFHELGWCHDDEVLLARLWRDGVSQSQIADILNKTRGAVCSRITKLGLRDGRGAQ